MGAVEGREKDVARYSLLAIRELVGENDPPSPRILRVRRTPPFPTSFARQGRDVWAPLLGGHLRTQRTKSLLLSPGREESVVLFDEVSLNLQDRESLPHPSLE